MKRLQAWVPMLGLTAFLVSDLFAADAKVLAKSKEALQVKYDEVDEFYKNYVLPRLEMSKEALQALQGFIGEWNGAGGPDKAKPAPKDPIWKETVKWGWKFKGDNAWLVVEVKDGKLFKTGEMRYDVDKMKYQLTAVEKDDKKQVYEGKLKEGLLTLERIDSETKETIQIQMNTASDGSRFIYRTARKKEGTTIFVKDSVVAATKVGEVPGPKDKKNICVVSGGTGTTMVRHKGENFYVCCSGCADAFEENPEKYIAEFKARKGKPVRNDD